MLFGHSKPRCSGGTHFARGLDPDTTSLGSTSRLIAVLFPFLFELNFIEF